MIHSVRFTAILDTNVIYPIIVRDLLFWLAHYDLYTPKWSSHIFNEWKEVMIRNSKKSNFANQQLRKSAIFRKSLIHLTLLPK